MGPYQYKHKPIQHRPYPNEEHFVRFDHRDKRTVIIKARKGRDGLNYEVQESGTTNAHLLSYNLCPDSDADTFTQALHQIRDAITV